MALESVSYIDDFVITNPVATDDVAQGDDHIRNIKKGIAASFPNFAGIAMTSTEAELNVLDGVTGGTTTASKALVVGSSSELDVLTVTSLTAPAIGTLSNADLVISPNGTGDVDFNVCSIMIDTGEGIKDAGGDEYIVFTETSTPVNYIGITQADADAGPIISAAGSDTNINLNLTPKGSGGVVVNGSFVTAETSTRSGAGAIPVTASLCEITSTGADAMTLADGVEGQHLTLLFVTDGGDATITPSNFANGTTITFADVNDSCDLVFTNSKWYMKGAGYGAPAVA